MNFMDRSISHMQQAFTSLQDDLSRTGDYNSQALDQLAAAQREALRINEEQKSTYQEYIRFMYQSIEKFSDVWEKNSQMLQGYSDEIAHMGPVQSSRDMQQTLVDISARLQDVQKRQQDVEITQALSAEEPDTSELLERTLKKLDSLEEQLAGSRLFRGFRRK